MSVSKDQRRTAAIALHHPDKLFKRNRGMLSMSKDQLHEFAAQSEKDLPQSKGYWDKAKAGLKKRMKG